jgi:hypothetical protein
MCGFSSTTDLGKMDFNFSCKNYNSKVYTCFAKDVVLLTWNTTKLVLHFSDFSVNFYEFYKLWSKHTKEGRI